MNDILRALWRGLVSQFHPRMLWLAVWPFLVAFAIWAVLGLVFRAPVVGWLATTLVHSYVGSSIDATFSWIGLDGGLSFVFTNYSRTFVSRMERIRGRRSRGE